MKTRSEMDRILSSVGVTSDYGFQLHL